MTCLAKYFLSVTSKVMGLLIELDLALEAIFMLNFLPVRHNENDFLKQATIKKEMKYVGMVPTVGASQHTD